MLYDSYKSKIQKVVDFMRKVFAHMVLIVIALATVALLVTAFLATKGIILDVSECKSHIYYGEKIEFNAKALFSSVRYEYSERGKDNWTESVPIYPGEYSVRGVSNASFRGKKYTKVNNFTILPLNIELKATESSVQYGDSPTVNTVTVNKGDVISELEFEYDSGSVGSRKVKVDIDTLVIRNMVGRDVTKCYNISTPETNIEIVKRVVNITTGSLKTEYSGKPVSCLEYEITGGDSLADGDTLKIVSYKTIKGVTPVLYGYNEEDLPALVIENPDMEKLEDGQNTLDFAVYNSDGRDVSENYDLQVIYGIIQVFPKLMRFSTPDGIWVYDDTLHGAKEYKADGLIEGQRIEVTGFCEIKNPTSSYIANAADIQIYDEEGNNVTYCYRIEKNFGKLVIKPRPIMLKTGSNTWVYDGKPHACTDYGVIVGGSGDMIYLPIVDGHTLFVEGFREITDAKKEINTPFNVRIYSGDDDVSACYSILYDLGVVEVTPRPIAVKTYSYSWVYDGKPHSYEKYDIFPVDEKLVTALADGERIKSCTFPEIINVGTLDNRPALEIVGADGKNKNSNYTIYYNDGAEITVTKRPVLVESESMSWVYDGFEHSYPFAFAVSDRYDKYEDLVDGHYIEVIKSPSIKYFGSAENTITVEDIKILCDGVDLKENYEISFKYGTIEITKRPITIVTGSEEWIYDGLTHTNTDY